MISNLLWNLFVIGTYATVYKGKSHLLNGYIALKEIRLEQEEGRLINKSPGMDFSMPVLSGNQLKYKHAFRISGVSKREANAH